MTLFDWMRAVMPSARRSQYVHLKAHLDVLKNMGAKDGELTGLAAKESWLGTQAYRIDPPEPEDGSDKSREEFAQSAAQGPDADFLEDVLNGRDGADTATIMDVVFRSGVEGALPLLKQLVKSLDHLDLLVRDASPEGSHDKFLELAPDYLTYEVRILIEWWFLPVLHRIKADIAKDLTQGDGA